MAEGGFDPTKNSYGKGEPIPNGMPSADTGVSPAPSSPTNAPSPSAMSSVGGSDDLKSITAGLADIERAKIDAETRSYGAFEGQTAKDLKTVEEARKNAGVEPGTLKPWNEKMEAAKYQTDPIAAFGSLGSVLGILASSFTHEPLVNAMSASAAAINAIKQGDKDAYDHAYKAWEANTKLALERHKIQHEQFEDAITLLKTNMAAGEAKMRLLAAKFGDQKSLFLLENGMDKDLIELQTARQTAALKMEEMLPKITENNAIMSGLFAKGYDPRHPTSPESQKALHEWQVEQAQIKQGGNLSLGKLDAQAVLEKAKELQAKAAKSGKSLSNTDAYLQARQQANIEKTGATLDEDTLQYMGEQLALGNTNILSGLGWGAGASNARMEIRKRATAYLVKQGIDPKAANAKVAEFMGEKRGESALGQREAQITSAITTARNTAPRVLETSKEVDRTQFPSINRIIIAGKLGVGDPHVVRFGIAVNTLINNYARALGAGNSHLSDSARHEAQEMLQVAWGDGQIGAAVDQMMIEMKSELEGAKQAHGEFQAGYAEPKQNAPPSKNIIRYDRQGNRLAN